MIISKPIEFLKRDFLIETSYKLEFLMRFLGIFFSTLTFFFLAKLLNQSVVHHLQPYGGDYFSFVLIGFAFSNYLDVSVRGFSKTIREAQMTGTLEALLITQTSLPTIVICSTLFNFLITSIQVVIFLLLGVLAFGMNIDNANLGGALIILFLTITSFSSLGIISASFVMVFKKGDPIAWMFTSLSWLLGGVYYPVSILPAWLQKFSYILPITYSLKGMRIALLRGATWKELIPDIFALSLFTMIMLPFSIAIFRQAVRKAKVDGSLTQY